MTLEVNNWVSQLARIRFSARLGIVLTLESRNGTRGGGDSGADTPHFERCQGRQFIKIECAESSYFCKISSALLFSPSIRGIRRNALWGRNALPSSLESLLGLPPAWLDSFLLLDEKSNNNKTTCRARRPRGEAHAWECCLWKASKDKNNKPFVLSISEVCFIILAFN